MYVTSDAVWIAELVRHDEQARTGDSSTLRTSVRHGHMRRITHGVYLPTRLWDAMDADARFRAVVHAAAMRYPGEVFSHLSAASLWRLPDVDAWPQCAEAIVAPTSGGRSRTHLTRHQGHAPNVDSIDRVQITSLARTVVDLAAGVGFTRAVAFADRALSKVDRHDRGVHAVRTDRAALETELDGFGQDRFASRRRRVVGFADGRAGSPGESISRVAIHALGFPAPHLQTDFHDADGLIGFVDFWWPEFSVIGEFDGHGKYLREELRAGQSPGEVVVKEKIREDRLRAQVRTVVRWDWAVARSPRALEARLRAAGLPCRGNRKAPSTR